MGSVIIWEDNGDCLPALDAGAQACLPSGRFESCFPDFLPHSVTATRQTLILALLVRVQLGQHIKCGCGGTGIRVWLRPRILGVRISPPVHMMSLV